MKFLMFLLGVGVGSSGAYILLKKKYDADMKEETEKIKKHYISVSETEMGKGNVKELPPEPKPVYEKEDIVNPSPLMEKPNLTDYANIIKKSQQKERSNTDISTDLRVLSAQEFEDLSDEYRVEDLIIYADGVVTDIRDKIVFDRADDVIDMAKNETFNDDGYLYVADDLKLRLYEISQDERAYKDVFGDEEE